MFTLPHYYDDIYINVQNVMNESDDITVVAMVPIFSAEPHVIAE